MSVEEFHTAGLAIVVQGEECVFEDDMDALFSVGVAVVDLDGGEGVVAE